MSGKAIVAMIAGALLVGAAGQAAPRWLQGAIVGGLVVLPLALLTDVLGGLQRGGRAWRPQQIAALALALVMVASGFTNAAGLNRSGIVLVPSAVSTPQSSVAPAPPDAEMIALVRDANRRIGASTPESAFDVDRLAAELGADVDKQFAFVRDNIRQEIYAGVLRGARGLLISRAGNSWDKSVLLAALLRRGGRDVRFARGRLASDRAAALVSKMFDQASRQAAVRVGVPEVPDAIAAHGRALLARIESRWRTAQTDLIAALDRSGVTLGDRPPVTEAALSEEAADHLWVEYRDGNRWVALDPSAAQRPGEAVVTSAETFQEIPDALFHRVTFRVKVEARRQQSIEERDALVWQATAAALHGARVLFTHQIGRTPLGSWRATPILVVDGQAYGARSFTEAGLEGGKAANALVAEAGRQTQGVGAVSGLFGSPAPPPVAASSELTAVSLEVEFADPAGHRDVVRREIIDRIGPVARSRNAAGTATLMPVMVASGVPVALAALHGCAVTAGALDPKIALERVATISAAADDGLALQRLMRSGSTPPAPDEQPRVRRLVESLPAVLDAAAQAIHVLSQRLATRIRTDNGTPLFYEATPRFAIVSLEPGGSPLAVDLRRTGLRVVARGSPGRDLVRANLARGVLDGVIEDAVASQAASGVRDAVPISTVAVFDGARAEGVRLVASPAGGLPRSAASDVALARMAVAAERQKQIVVMPERAVSITSTPRFAWWQVNPQTGDTVGVLDTGLHGAQSTSENIALADTVALPGARALGAGAAANAGSGFITITLSAKEALIVGVGLGVLASGVALLIVSIIATT